MLLLPTSMKGSEAEVRMAFRLSTSLSSSSRWCSVLLLMGTIFSPTTSDVGVSSTLKASSAGWIESSLQRHVTVFIRYVKRIECHQIHRIMQQLWASSINAWYLGPTVRERRRGAERAGIQTLASHRRGRSRGPGSSAASRSSRGC